MNDYISRDDVLKAIDYQHEVNNVFESEAAYVQMWETINDDIGIKSADVQPVDRWISVKDRLPQESGFYLTYYSKQIHVSQWFISANWYNEHGGNVTNNIEYWKPLPEPPKDGDTNG